MQHDTPETPDKLQQLSAKINAMKAQSGAEDGGKNKGESQALRLVSDFAAAALVGCGIGYGADQWWNTAPWGLIIGLFFGVAAGARSMLHFEKKGQ